MNGEEAGHLELADSSHLPAPAGDRMGGAHIGRKLVRAGRLLRGLLVRFRRPAPDRRTHHNCARRDALHRGGLRCGVAGCLDRGQAAPLLGWLIAVCTLLGLAVVVLILYSFETSRSAPRLLSFSAIVETIHKLAVARNDGTWEEPAAARILTTSTYLGPMLSGLMLGLRDRGLSRWLSLVGFLPSLLITVILTTRSSLLLALALGVSSYLATTIATGKAPSVTLKRVVWLAGVVVVIAGGFVLIQMARYAGWSSGRPTAVVDSLWLNTLPYMGVFSGWLQRYGLWDSLHLTFGQYTFAGAFDLFHIHSRVAGLYTEQVVINGSQYNVYTAFRGLVEDFTVPGALIFLALVGFGAELVYQRVRSGNLLYVGILAAFYAVTLWSFVVDIFIYNTIVLTFVILIGYLAIASRRSVRKAVERFSPALSANRT